MSGQIGAYVFSSLVLLPIAIAFVHLGMRLVSINIEPKMENPVNDFFVPFIFGLVFYGVLFVGLVWMGGVLALYVAFFLWYAARRAYSPDVMKYLVDIEPTSSPVVQPRSPLTTRSASGARPPASILHQGKDVAQAFGPESGLHMMLFLPVAIALLFLAFDPFSALVYSVMMVVVLGVLLVRIGFDRIFPVKLRGPFKDPEVGGLQSRQKGTAMWFMRLLFAAWAALLLLVILVPTMHSQLILVVWGMDALILIPAGIMLIYMRLFKRSAHELAGKRLAKDLKMNIPLAVFPALIVSMVLIATGFWQGGTLLLVYAMIFAGLANWSCRAAKKDGL